MFLFMHLKLLYLWEETIPTQNMLTVVDFDLDFKYILTRWEGSAHDALVLRDALERPNGLSALEGIYFI